MIKLDSVYRVFLVVFVLASNIFSLAPKIYAHNHKLLGNNASNLSNISAKGSQRLTALCLAAKKGKVNLVKRLLNGKININEKLEGGNSILHCAASSGQENPQLFELLIRRGAIVNCQASDGITPLLMLMDNDPTRRIKSIETLIKHQADVNLPENGDGWTPFLMSADWNSKALLRIMIKNGANIAARLKDGRSALMLMARQDDLEPISLILQKSEINQTNNSGETALFIAARKGNIDVIRMLLDAGASLNILNNDKKSALQVAKEQLRESGSNKARLEKVVTLMEKYLNR